MTANFSSSQAANVSAESNYSDDLSLAFRLADAADEITMARFEAADLQIDSKPDLTPVSDADTAVERKIRDILATYRPEDSVLGEEFGGEPTFENRQWVIDPIDGTKNFVRGVPVWATLISLLEDGVPVIGLVSAPALSRRWWAAPGIGSWRSFTAPNSFDVDATPSAQPRQLQVSRVRDIQDASLSFSSLSGWADRGLREQLVALSDRTWRLRGFGDFWSYMMVAEGSVDIAAEPEVSLWDLAALVPIVTEAGGTFTNIEGEAGPHGGSAVATNGLLHQEVLDALQ